MAKRKSAQAGPPISLGRGIDALIDTTMAAQQPATTVAQQDNSKAKEVMVYLLPSQLQALERIELKRRAAGKPRDKWNRSSMIREALDAYIAKQEGQA